ncbi:hypothetical protein JCM35486_26460 [Blautia wexlerae]
MYAYECLTSGKVHCEECSPFSGACYPEVEGVCGPDCSPEGGCSPDCGPWDVDCGPKVDFL